MNLLKKQLVKENYHKETLKITIDMAWPAIVESFFVAFAGLIDSLMVNRGLFVVHSARQKGPFCVRAYRLYPFCQKIRTQAKTGKEQSIL